MVSIRQVLYLLVAVRDGVQLLLLEPSSLSSYLSSSGDQWLMAEEERKVLLWNTCMCSVTALFCLLLVVGACRQSPCLVCVFRLYFGLLLALSTVVAVCALCAPKRLLPAYQWQRMHQLYDPATADAIIYAALGLYLALTVFFWYLWLVVHWLYRELAFGGGPGPAAAQAGTWSDGPAAAPPGTWDAKQDARQQMPMV